MAEHMFSLLEIEMTSELRTVALPPSGSGAPGHTVEVGELPASLVPDRDGFEALWALHPGDFHEIAIHGRRVKTPRWQQAYGADYHYTGRVNAALPLVPPMDEWLAWSRARFDPRLNGLLLNWYDGRAGHYIGRHRDSDKHRTPGT